MDAGLFENLDLALGFKKVARRQFLALVAEEAERISVYIVSDVSGALRDHGICYNNQIISLEYLADGPEKLQLCGKSNEDGNGCFFSKPKSC